MFPPSALPGPAFSHTEDADSLANTSDLDDFDDLLSVADDDSMLDAHDLNLYSPASTCDQTPLDTRYGLDMGFRDASGLKNTVCEIKAWKFAEKGVQIFDKLCFVRSTDF